MFTGSETSIALCERHSYVQRTPRARHGACDRLRPGRLRAGHAVCLICPTLESVFCARKRLRQRKQLDNRNNKRPVSSHARPILQHRNDHRRFFGPESARFCQSARRRFPQCAFALPPVFPKPCAHPIRSEQTANNGAAENRSGAAARVTLAAPRRPAAQPARHAPQPLRGL